MLGQELAFGPRDPVLGQRADRLEELRTERIVQVMRLQTLRASAEISANLVGQTRLTGQLDPCLLYTSPSPRDS